MKSLIPITFIGLVLSFTNCDKKAPIKPYRISDATLIRSEDSLRSIMDSSAAYYQREYVKSKISQFERLLEELNIQSLKDIKRDTIAYRLICSFSWRQEWCGTPIAFSIYGDSKSAHVETVEILSSLAQGDKRTNTRKQLNYTVENTSLIDLQDHIDHIDLWLEYSFDTDASGLIDHDLYCLELRSGQQYKLLVREKDDYLVRDLLLPFMKATHFNDTLANEWEAHKVFHR